MAEIRCLGPHKLNAARPCNHLLAVTSDDFEGDVSTCCSCGQQSPGLTEPRLDCTCSKWLASGVIRVGYIQLACPRDRALVRLSGYGPVLIETSRKVKPPEVKAAKGKVSRPPNKRVALTDAEILAAVEARWRLLRFDRARRSTEVAVGVRFDVFSRDGFRCVYCGRGPDQGILLEADHHIPRSAGGADTMANLVTACWDCNRGKSAKLIAS